MSRSIFVESSGTYSGDVVQLVKEGVEDLIPYKIISRSELRQGYYVARKSVLEHNVTASFGDHSNEIGRSSICFQEMSYKMHVFDTVQRISLQDLMSGSMSEDEVKANLELGLMNDAYHSVIFGKPDIKMEGIATLTGRSKITSTSSSLNSGSALHQKVVEAKSKSEEYKKNLSGFYHLLLPHKFSRLLLELYSEPQYITVKDALLKDHHIVTLVFKGLEHPILYEPNPEVMYLPMLPEIFFRRFAGPDGDYIHASMQSAGVIHFSPQEVVEITISS
ncbi:hypothetical protein [Borrelia hermsii]|uniref:Uncharacterized protein n=2 Tax=Borrelia hermsii TaxID=140 RepID=A0AAN1CFL7_BORHE|nr:hypothetical protein [Borrelia hermsii]AMR76150.1 hypothetical protein A0V01_06055 [Borrelia hermsii]ANA44004.1 hypothetical protein AXX13_G16 [Borrelia hermsii HS1]UPA08655.1 hypothetical protein bhDAH_001379 [Borrelia hermsii DAH]